jgi:hypothetical protein
MVESLLKIFDRIFRKVTSQLAATAFVLSACLIAIIWTLYAGSIAFGGKDFSIQLSRLGDISGAILGALFLIMFFVIWFMRFSLLRGYASSQSSQPCSTNASSSPPGRIGCYEISGQTRSPSRTLVLSLRHCASLMRNKTAL